MSDRVVIPRRAAERLRELSTLRERADAEARGLVAGLALALGVEASEVVGVDDGDEPALLLSASLGPPAGEHQEHEGVASEPHPLGVVDVVGPEVAGGA